MHYVATIVLGTYFVKTIYAAAVFYNDGFCGNFCAVQTTTHTVQ